MRKAIKAVSRSTCSVFQKRVHHYKHFFRHSFLSGGVGPMQNLWLLSMSSSWDKKLPLPTLTNPWLSKLYRYHSKMNFFLLLGKTMMINFCHPAQQGSICMEQKCLEGHHQESGIWRLSEHRQASAGLRGEAYHAHCCWSSTGAHSVDRCSDSCKCKRWAETSTLKL